MSKFRVLSSAGVDINDLFLSAESIDQRSIRVSSTEIRAETDNTIGASEILFEGRDFRVSGSSFSGTVTDIQFFRGGTEIAMLSNVSIGAQALANAIADSASETGFEPLLQLFSRFTYNYKGGRGDDGFTGGLKRDTIDGGGGDDLLSGELGSDVVRGGDGNDILSGDYGLSTGGSGNFDRGGDDRLYGDAGNDNIRGDAGNDRLFGGSGNDILNGGIGRDVIVGGKGIDRLSGGEGADTFVFGNGDSPFSGNVNNIDEIADFVRGDRIDLSAMDANTTRKGNQALEFIGISDTFRRPGEIALIKSGANDYYIAGNTDRNLDDIDFLIYVNIVGTESLREKDFIL